MITEGVLIAIASVISALVASAIAHHSKHDELEASPYNSLAERVVHLEARVERLESDRRSDRAWIARTINRLKDHDVALEWVLLPFPAWWVPEVPPQPADDNR